MCYSDNLYITLLADSAEISFTTVRNIVCCSYTIPCMVLFTAMARVIMKQVNVSGIRAYKKEQFTTLAGDSSHLGQ